MFRFCSFRCHNTVSFQTVVRSRLKLPTSTVSFRELSLSSLANQKDVSSSSSSINTNISGIKIEDDDSNSSNSNNSNSKSKSNDVVMHMLYQRDASRNALPKASFLVSSLNSAYWLWYVFDFIPAVNASPIEELHADPVYGFGGLGLSLLIQSAFTLYPLSLVSRIGYRASRATSPMASTSTSTANLGSMNTRITSGRGQNQSRKNKTGTTLHTTTQEQRDIVVWKHTLPFLHTSSKPLIIPVGGITMDKTSDDTRKILEELGGDVGKFEGHLGLTRISEKERKTKTSDSNSGSLTINFPLLVEIRSPSEVYNSELMMQTLLSGKFKNHARGESKSREGSVGRQGHLHGDEVHRQRTKHKKTQRHHRKNNRGAKR